MKMKLSLIALVLISSLPAVAQITQMQNTGVQVQAEAGDRWCRFDNLDHGSIQICSAYTYEQCMASRSPGNTGCFLNPRYDQRYRR
jgi:hypothetical protein